MTGGNPRTRAPFRVAVVGAGISGLACAGRLREHSCEVVVLDRGRGPGGRMSTRRVTVEGRVMTFDHGAPFFDVADGRFRREVRSWSLAGACGAWPAHRVTWRDGVIPSAGIEAPVVVGVPTMSMICKHLARGLDVRCETTVVEVTRDPEGWRLAIDRENERAGGQGPFDAVVVAAPGPQAARLLGRHSPVMARTLAELRMRPAWVSMLVIDAVWPDLPDVVDVDDDAVIRRLVRDDAKPGRTPGQGRTRWVAHAGPDWSAARFDAPRDDVARELERDALRVIGAIAGDRLANDRLTFSAAHRWGLARPARLHPEACVLDPDAGLAVCGDGCGGSGVEAAFLSGRAAADGLVSSAAGSA